MVVSSGITKTDNGNATYKVIKSGGTANSWSEQAYSLMPFGVLTGSKLVVSFRAGETTTYKMMGLNSAFSDVDSNASYSTLDYAFYPATNGALYIYESGSSRGYQGPYTTNDRFSITYDNNWVRYYQHKNFYTGSPKETILIRSVKIGSGRLFHLDSSLYTANASFNNVQIGRADIGGIGPKGSGGSQGGLGGPGNKGGIGQPGAKGTKGNKGGPGNKGAKGAKGNQGPSPAGAKGAKGNIGPSPRGSQGPTGPQGGMGSGGGRGAKGAKGDAGAFGPPGPPGGGCPTEPWDVYCSNYYGCQVQYTDELCGNRTLNMTRGQSATVCSDGRPQFTYGYGNAFAGMDRCITFKDRI